MNSTVIAALVALVIGFGAGYWVSQSQEPATLSHTMDAMTSELEGKTGDEFDKAFIQEMIVHHEGAVEMAELALQHAQHSEIKDMAQDIIDAQTREITTMRGWLQLWYGN